MILPIIAYGDPVLRKRAVPIEQGYPGLSELIANMYDTMYASHGVGLAAPQVGVSIRLFITDGAPFEEEEVKDFKQVFINPRIIEEDGDPWKFNEGCLSIPHIREDVSRKEGVLIEYQDEQWIQRRERFTGLAARIIQHEYDHIEGVLFTDRISPLRRRLLNKRLSEITHGNIKVDYKMRFPSPR